MSFKCIFVCRRRIQFVGARPLVSLFCWPFSQPAEEQRGGVIPQDTQEIVCHWRAMGDSSLLNAVSDAHHSPTQRVLNLIVRVDKHLEEDAMGYDIRPSAFTEG